MRGRAVARACAVGAMLAGIGVACGGSEDSVARAKLAEGCLVNSDCASPLVCAFKTCHDKCSTSRDCPDGELCVQSDKPFHVCQLKTEATCKTNGDCPGSQICG